MLFLVQLDRNRSFGIANLGATGPKLVKTGLVALPAGCATGRNRFSLRTDYVIVKNRIILVYK